MYFKKPKVVICDVIVKMLSVNTIIIKRTFKIESDLFKYGATNLLIILS